MCVTFLGNFEHIFRFFLAPRKKIFSCVSGLEAVRIRKKFYDEGTRKKINIAKQTKVARRAARPCQNASCHKNCKNNHLHNSNQFHAQSKKNYMPFQQITYPKQQQKATPYPLKAPAKHRHQWKYNPFYQQAHIAPQPPQNHHHPQPQRPHN